MILVIRETHEAPAEVARELLLAGGVNRFGDANYRAVWGWSRLDWGEVGGSRGGWDAAAGSGGAAAGAQIFAARPVAHREVDASGELWFAGNLARGNVGNCGWAQRCGAGTISFARGLRALLHAAGAARGIRAIDEGGGAAYCAGDRSEPRGFARQEQGSAR